jgi:hypothetical protein
MSFSVVTQLSDGVLTMTMHRRPFDSLPTHGFESHAPDHLPILGAALEVVPGFLAALKKAPWQDSTLLTPLLQVDLSQSTFGEAFRQSHPVPDQSSANSSISRIPTGQGTQSRLSDVHLNCRAWTREIAF